MNRLLLIMAVIILVIIYGLFNPENFQWFPKCPFYTMTGLKCPGCGSQRAIHALLHLNVQQAFQQNALLIPAIPYVLLGLYIDQRPNQQLLKVRSVLYGQKAIYLSLVIILGFAIVRNLL